MRVMLIYLRENAPRTFTLFGLAKILTLHGLEVVNQVALEFGEEGVIQMKALVDQGGLYSF